LIEQEDKIGVIGDISYSKISTILWRTSGHMGVFDVWVRDI